MALTAESKLLIAAAKRPAIASPVTPVGRCASRYWAKTLCDPSSASVGAAAPMTSGRP